MVILRLPGMAEGAHQQFRHGSELWSAEYDTYLQYHHLRVMGHLYLRQHVICDQHEIITGYLYQPESENVPPRFFVFYE